MVFALAGVAPVPTAAASEFDDGGVIVAIVVVVVVDVATGAGFF
jgi:hypothetical protein